jgi:DNA-binding response OmpR family regulator
MSQKVLLVDDDERLRELVKEYLEGYGYQITALPDGLSVLKTIRKESPDIIILDIMMPEQDGLDVLREIRLKYSVPVIMLTAKGDDADRIVGLELGADDYLPKPFNPRELLARMKAVIRRHPFNYKGEISEGLNDPQQMQRQLKAILSADVKDYSRLMADDEMSTIHILTTYRDLITSHIQKHLGRVVDSPGDNILAEFGSVLNAVQCAVEIQNDLRIQNDPLPNHRRMEFRIGINLGDVVIEKGRIYGDGVNIAARIEGLAEAGGISISGTVYDQVENKLSLGYEYMGEKSVKNIMKPVRVYRIQLDIENSEPQNQSPKQSV